MIKKYLATMCVLLFLFPVLSWGADKIQGNACYTYGDNESLVQAEQMTKTLAIRNAIESYSIFIESTSKITDFQLSSDLINTISTGQVKRIKILKRLQSGRKLCYSVEGYVEPNNLKTAIKEYLSGNHRIATGRVQENEWIKIVHIVPPSYLYEILGVDRILQVEIEFLKYCKATTKETPYDEVLKNPRSYTDKQINDAAGESFVKVLVDPRYRLKYRCDYHTTVFATFYDKSGSEIDTYDDIPMGIKNNEYKLEILPGETVWKNFLIPKDAVSWEVWVPK
jgi:hypothetical protein